MRGYSGNSYEDSERLMQEPEHLRELLRQAKKTIDHQQDVIKEWQLEVLRYKKAIETHDDIEHECYSIADRMMLESETGGQT